MSVYEASFQSAYFCQSCYNQCHCFKTFTIHRIDIVLLLFWGGGTKDISYVGRPNRENASIHYIHGVGVITKLYFVIFAAFKESMALSLTHRSFKVVHLAPIESTYATLYRPLIVTFALCSTVSVILPVFLRPKPIFP